MHIFSEWSRSTKFPLNNPLTKVVLAKFVNFCGQRGARLDADQPLYDSNSGREKNPIFRFLNVVLFNSLDIHLESLRKAWVDKTVVKPRWKKFVDQLNGEWSSFTVFVSKSFIHRGELLTIVVDCDACCGCQLSRRSWSGWFYYSDQIPHHDYHLHVHTLRHGLARGFPCLSRSDQQ